MELLTTKEAAAILRVSRPTLMKLVKDGQIKARKVGSTWRFRRADLEDALR